MKQQYLEQINELLELSQLCFFKDIEVVIRRHISDITDEDIEEIKQYVNEFVEYCMKYGDILADKFKVPFLPGDDKAKGEIEKYVVECKKMYPKIDRKYIRHVFSTVCWLTNR